MAPTIALAAALVEARSCLAALADNASDFDESVRYERILLDLDDAYPNGPALVHAEGTEAELLDRLEAAVDRLIDLGADLLTAELLLVRAHYGQVS